ncbi:serine/threonine-protein kinase [Nocardioides sp.]|uniref:serine/threonine-protein kinase n=1 Tax=Nocardioides sp. TaxID=35761 RepID=UPI003527A092
MSAPRIPGYRYIDHLGSGGFADVFLYEQEWPHQRVAIKVVRPDVPLNEREKSLFTSEANAMARLADHPYIVTVMTAGETEDHRPYLVMRFCPPPDLGVRVRANPMPVAEAISTGIKLASAIETAHRSGILHRDIKPSNVLVTSYSEPALTDFGIAGGMHEVEGDTDVRISYPWSPPEMLDGRSNGSVASDVYSLGATIWHLLVGRSPFSIPGGDNSTRALSARILHADPPATRRPDAPPGLDRLLQQCLAKEPSHRPQSALELARSLQRIEATAGYARTAIAVEADLPGTPVRDFHLDSDSDATRLKPPTLVSGSAPRSTTGVAEAPDTEDRAPRVSGTVWAVLGTVALAVVGGLLMFSLGRGDAGDNPDDGPTSRPPSTPASLDPGLLTEPVLKATRRGKVVTVTWTAGDGGQPGDTWQWQRADSGEVQRTADSSVTLRTSKPVCVQARLIRAGSPSPWSDVCAD